MTDRTVTLVEGAEIVGCNWKTLSMRVRLGHFSCVGVRPGPGSARLYRLSDIRKSSRDNLGSLHFKPPDGYYTAIEAGAVIGMPGTTVCKKAGEFNTLRLPWGVRGRKRVFFEKSSVHEYAAKNAKVVKFVNSRERETTAVKMDEYHEILVTSPNDQVCLYARRKLWEEKGRKWPKKLFGAA